MKSFKKTWTVYFSFEKKSFTLLQTPFFFFNPILVHISLGLIIELKNHNELNAG